MFRKKCNILKVFLLVLLSLAPGSMAQQDECYGPGSIATAVIVTIILTIVSLYVLYLIWKRYWIKRKGKHLVLETDPEKGKGEYAYDNAGFKDVHSTPLDKASDRNGKLETSAPKSKWSQWSPLGGLMTKNEKQRTVDDSALQPNEIKAVSLKSHDFTGLGFNIYGNMRDGIFIKDVLHRGPASESGKLNPGDRVKSVTINFEHVVYEDALTILSYASPYEVVVEAQSGKSMAGLQNSTRKTTQLGHPMYRSSSTTDLMQIQKTTKKRLFPVDDVSSAPSPYSSLQKTRSNATTLERDHSAHSPQHLKTQLEQKINQNHKQQLKSKDDKTRQEIEPVQKTENKYQKFGIKVLPVEPKLDLQQASPKSAENSQNDNNINLERHLQATPIIEEIKTTLIGIDEVDDKSERKILAPPPIIKKREKNLKIDEDDVTPEASFERRDSLNGSGIKRDKDGIPQEIPGHMLNAAVAARRNRRASAEEDMKSPKKPKGRAPAPPDDKTKSPQTPPAQDKNAPDYASDSDVETDNLSSVNTIELNASDITIHQTEEADETQNRRTASTGDLTKIQRARKTSTGTLERAQSLDITDTTIPSLSKKRKGGSIEDARSGSDESLYGKALVHKEPRLSLALDGLNTFQRSRLKKSTEWGNLEDAVLNLDPHSHVDALVNKINEIKQDSDVVKTFEFYGQPNHDEEEIELVKPVVSLDSDTPVVLENGHVTETVLCVNDDVEESSQPIILTYATAATENLLQSERGASFMDPYYNLSNKMYDINASDDIKVSRHSLGSLETTEVKSSNGNVSSITIGDTNADESDLVPNTEDLYTTANDITSFGYEKVSVISPNTTLEDFHDTVTIEGPTSLSVEVLDDEPQLEISSSSFQISTPSTVGTPNSNFSMTYITEIQVLTPNSNGSDDTESPEKRNVESNIKHFESNIQTGKVSKDDIDPEKELHKIQEIAEEQLKKLPEMRFSTSSYETSKVSDNNCLSQVEQLRSNFEKGSTKPTPKVDISKSRIPVATSKTPPTSPERRDSRIFDPELDKEIVEIMASPVHSTPISTSLKYQPKPASKNISITSIRSNSKIPSGFPNRPPVPPRKYESVDGDATHRFSTNGSVDSSFKQWVFNPNDNSVTNLTVAENKPEHK